MIHGDLSPRSPRFNARSLAVCALYSYFACDKGIVAHQCFSDNADIYRNERINCQYNFAYYLFKGALDKHDDIVHQCSQYLVKGWTFDKLAIFFKSILLIGAFEIIYVESVDDPVIINEYINVTRKYMRDSDAASINKILDCISKNKNDI